MVKKNGIITSNANTFATLYRMLDLLLIQIALYFAINVYDVEYTRDFFILSLISMVGFSVISETFSLYRSWRSGSFKEMAFYTFIAWSASFVFILLFVFFSKTGVEYSRVATALWFVFSLGLLLSWRAGLEFYLRDIRRKGLNIRKVAIMGLTAQGQKLVKEILKNPQTGYRLEAVFDDRPADRLCEEFREHRKGKISEGIERVENDEFDMVFIALPLTAEKRVTDILSQLGNTAAHVQLVPNLFMYNLMSASMTHIGEMQTINVFNNPMLGFHASLKRLQDIVFASFILVLIAIPLLIIAAVVKLTSKGPVLFKQHRYGVNGKKIEVWKFRSMTVTENADVVVQAKKGDMRITKVGAFLRRTSLDELPQFFNVLQGSMSVVGPRPHAVAHNEKYREEIDFYMLRHRMKPGITGWAQINGWRGETDTLDKMDMRIRYDLEYIRNWSVWMDVKIIFLTVFRSFNDKNAY